MDIFFTVKGVAMIGIWIAIIYFLSDWRETKAKTLLFGFAVLSAVTTIGFFIIGPVNRVFGMSGVGSPAMAKTLSVMLNLTGLAAAVCVLGYVLVEGRERKGSGGAATAPPQRAVPVHRATSAGQDNPYYGVGGWLKMVVVMQIYVVPVLFVLGQLAAWTTYVNVASRYPGVIVTGLIEMTVWGYLVYRGVHVGKGLRDLRPRAVQETRKFLIACLAWGILSIPVSFLSGFDPEWLVAGAARTLFSSIISFVIWYSYFNVSRRVEATYPDWKEQVAANPLATPGSS